MTTQLNKEFKNELSSPYVEASLSFLARDPLYDIEKPYTILNYEPPEGLPRMNLRRETVDCIPIADMRVHKLNLEQHGITFVKFNTSMAYDDFLNPKLIEEVYLAELRDFVRSYLGVPHVHIYEYGIRRRDENFPVSTGKAYTQGQPVVGVHIDYTLADVCSAIIQVYGEDRGKEMMKGRFSSINVWKPLKGPVIDYPLALCDPTSVDTEKDLVACDNIYPGLISEIFQVHYNKNQRWYYVKEQQVDELLIFKGQDSDPDIVSGVPHCSFQNPVNSSQIQRRESIEARILVFY